VALHLGDMTGVKSQQLQCGEDLGDALEHALTGLHLMYF
jgi:hypothetical protein